MRGIWNILQLEIKIEFISDKKHNAFALQIRTYLSYMQKTLVGCGNMKIS